MINFDIITIFPEIFDSYFKESILKRAQVKKLIKIRIHNLREWTTDRHQTVDDKPYGGGIGMVVKVEPIFRALSTLTKLKIKNKKLKIVEPKTKIILFTPRGKKFSQKLAYKFSKLNRIIMICGRYEGVDERVAKYIATDCISIGDFVLMGGELPAMILIETIARLIPGVLGKPQLLKERVTREKGFVEYPQYTRPEVFSPRLRPAFAKSSAGKRGFGGQAKKRIKWCVPKVLLSGHHKKIEEWRRKHQKIIEK